MEYVDRLKIWGNKEANRKLAYRQVLRVRRQGEAYPEIKPDVDDMTEAFFLMQLPNIPAITNKSANLSSSTFSS